MANGTAYLWTENGQLRCRIYNYDGTIDSETEWRERGMSPYNLEQLGKGLGKYKTKIKFLSRHLSRVHPCE